MISKAEIAGLLEWFDRNRREYPWSKGKTPYRVWISEIMLQQTVASTVIAYFERWCAQYPGIEELARADLQHLLSLWEGLGYYSRCRNLHKGAKYLLIEKGSALPDTYGELIKVPGIGDYTARAILSIGFGKKYPVLDANVKRILQRLAAEPEWDRTAEKKGWALLDGLIPPEQPGDFNEAMMQLGQQVCTTGSPRCKTCPFIQKCRAFAENLTESIPPGKTRKLKMSEKTVLLFHSKGKILLRKKKKGLFHDLWLLPTVEEDSARRMERINNEWSLLETRLLTERKHFYTDNKDTLSPCLITSDEIDLSSMTPSDDESYEHLWVAVEEIDNYPSPSVYRKIIEEVKDYLQTSST